MNLAKQPNSFASQTKYKEKCCSEKKVGLRAIILLSNLHIVLVLLSQDMSPELGIV